MSKQVNVLIAINKYPSSPLAGCINDSLNVEARLRRGAINDSKCMEERLRAGARPGLLQIWYILRDEKATTANIRDAFKKAVAQLQPGDDLNVHYSGHGSQVRGSDPQLDGSNDYLLEIICPIDMDWDDPITDKELRATFSKAPAGVNMTFFSDSCHSGNLDRNLAAGAVAGFVPANKPRFLPNPYLGRPTLAQPPVRSLWSWLQSLFADWYNEQAASPVSGAVPAVTAPAVSIEGRPRYVFVSGCRADQTSADTVVDGEACGAATAFFCKALDAGAANWADAVVKGDQLLAKNGYEQVMTIAGNDDQLSKLSKPWTPASVSKQVGPCGVHVSSSRLVKGSAELNAPSRNAMVPPAIDNAAMYLRLRVDYDSVFDGYLVRAVGHAKVPLHLTGDATEMPWQYIASSATTSVLLLPNKLGLPYSWNIPAECPNAPLHVAAPLFFSTRDAAVLYVLELTGMCERVDQVVLALQSPIRDMLQTHEMMTINVPYLLAEHRRGINWGGLMTKLSTYVQEHPEQLAAAINALAELVNKKPAAEAPADTSN